MKTALLHLACLLILIQFAAEVDLGPASSQASTDTKVSANATSNEWRRTRDGWEPMTWAVPERPRYDGGVWRPLRAIHPLAIASLQGLISLGALVLFAPPDLGRTGHGHLAQLA